ncbi:MAG: biopolymer transporter ExbD [Bacteroidetes bacterium]|nr:biopolymer transporter ExbD [Bacteroidota bacterium]
MNLKRKHREAAEVSTESLNDIMFFLLLFFLILSTLANPNIIKLTLPNSSHSDQLPKQKITIEVTADRNYYINNTPIPFSDMENALKILTEKVKDPVVILRLDNTLAVQDLADVLQIGYKLNIKMVLATKPPNG